MIYKSRTSTDNSKSQKFAIYSEKICYVVGFSYYKIQEKS